MESRISIEIDFENGNQPVIQILQKDSDDVRDKIIKAFTECLGGSSWCQIKWHSGFSPASPVNDTTGSRIFITPIRPEDFEIHSALMIEQDRLNKEFGAGKSAD